VLNRSLVKRFCAEDVTGLKLITEAAELAYAKLAISALDLRVKSALRKRQLVGERSIPERRGVVRCPGLIRSDYAGTSSDKTGLETCSPKI
jgi:hypothetical protein